MPVHPVRLLIAALIGAGLLLVALAALTGLLLVLALIVGLAVLNVVYLPRAAMRLHLQASWLALMLIPFMILAGVIVAGLEGAAWGAGVWLAAIGLPRAIGRDVVRRVRRRVESRLTYYDVPTRTSKVDPDGRPLPPADGRGRGESGP
jgi:hypothetical protein